VVSLAASNLAATGPGTDGAPPGRILVTFDLTLTSLRNDITLVRPTFPTPPADPLHRIYLIPLEVVPTALAGNANEVIVELPNYGTVVPGIQFDGAPHSFFIDTECGAGDNRCFRFEPYEPLPANAVSSPRSVGFLIDPTVGSFRARLLVAADFSTVIVPASRFEENFDDGALDSTVTVWNNGAAMQPPGIVADETALGGRSLRLTWTGGIENDQGARVTVPGGPLPVVHVRFRYKLPANADLTGLMQLVRFKGRENLALGSLSIAGGQWAHWTDTFSDGFYQFAPGSGPAECLGRWCWIEASMDYSSGTSGRARLWINGVEVLDYTRTGIAYGGGIASVELWGYGFPPETRSELLDELAVGPAYLGVPFEEPDPDPPPPDSANGEVYFAADFDNCSGKARVGTLLPPSFGSGGDGVAITQTNPYPGGLCSAEFTYAGSPDPADDAWAEWRFRLTRPVTELWIAWSAYYPGPADTSKGTAVFAHRPVSPNNNKLLRLWDEDYSSYRLKLGFSMTAGALSHIIPEYGKNRTGVGPGGSRGASNAISHARLGRWLRFLAHVKTATAANNDGVIELWQDGIPVIGNSELPLYPAGGEGNYLRNGYLQGWANSGFAATTKVWIAKVVAASTRALVEPR
jgi:hypothetical protein